MAGEEDILLNLTIGDSGKTLETMKDVEKFFDDTQKKLESIAATKAYKQGVLGNASQAKAAKAEYTELASKLNDVQTQFLKIDPLAKGLNGIKFEETKKAVTALGETSYKMGQSLDNAMATASVDAGALATAVEAVTKGVEEQRNAVLKLRLSQAATTDPKEWRQLNIQIQQASKYVQETEDNLVALADTQAYMARGGTFLTQFSDLSDFIAASAKSQDDLAANTKAVTDEQTKLNKEIGESLAERIQLRKVEMATDDPKLLEAIKAKQGEITEDIARRTKLLKAQRDLQNTKAGSGADRLGKFADAANQISGLAGGLSGLTKGLIDTRTNTLAWGGVLDANGKIIQGTQMDISQFAAGISVISEQASVGFKRTEAMGLQLKSFGDSITDWGTRVQETNAQLEASGQQLTLFQKATGAVAGGTQNAAKAMSIASEALNVIGGVSAGISAGFSIYDEATGRSSKQIAKRIDILKQDAAATEKQNQLMKSGIASTNDTILEIRKQISANAKNSQDIIDSSQANTSWLDQVHTIADATAQFYLNSGQVQVHMYGQVGEALDKNSTDAGQLNKQLTALANEGFYKAVVAASENAKIAEKAASVVGDQKSKEEDLYNARVDILGKQDQLTTDMTKEQTDFNKDAIDTQKSRDADDLKEVKSHLQDLKKIDDQYAATEKSDRLDHLKALSGIEQSVTDDIAKTITDFNKSMGDLKKEFDTNNLKDEADFNKTEAKNEEQHDKQMAKLDEDFNKAEVKRKKDLAAQLMDAEMANDALQYFQLQRQGDADAQDAAAQHADDVTQAQQDYSDQQKQDKEQHDQDMADRKKEYEEKKVEAAAQLAEDEATRMKQYQKEVADEDAQYADKRKQADFQYAQDKADSVKAFNEQMDQNKAARAVEDKDKLDRLAERRKELDDAFQLELTYFKNREDALNGYITGITKYKAELESIQKLSAVGSGDLNKDQVADYFKAVEDALGNLVDKAKAVGGQKNLSATDNAALGALTELDLKLKSIAENGGHIDFNDIFNSDQVKKSGLNVAQLFSDTLATTTNKNAVAFADASKASLDYADDASRKNAAAVDVVTKQGTTLINTLIDQHQGYLDQIGVQQTDAGLQTQAELKKQSDAQQIILTDNGKETLDQLKSDAAKTGADVLDNFKTMSDDRDKAQQGEIDEYESHFKSLKDDTMTFHDTVAAATKEAQQQQADDVKWGQDNQIDAVSTGQKGVVDAQTTGLEAQTTAQTDHNATMGTLQDVQNASDLDRADSHNQAKIELDQAQNKTELDQTQKSNDDQNDLWKKFFIGLDKQFSDNQRKLYLDLQNTSVNGINAILSVNATMYQSIATMASQALASIQSSMDSFSSSSSSGSGSEYLGGGYNFPSGSGSSSGGSGSNVIGFGVMAAKGAFINKPTALVAGEGKSPEMVFPFDESKGLPDNILRQFQQNVLNGSVMSPKAVGGDSTGAMMGSMIAAMKSMQSGMNMNIDRIQIGSDISRSEILSQFTALQKALIEVLQEQIG